MVGLLLLTKDVVVDRCRFGLQVGLWLLPRKSSDLLFLLRRRQPYDLFLLWKLSRGVARSAVWHIASSLLCWILLLHIQALIDHIIDHLAVVFCLSCMLFLKQFKEWVVDGHFYPRLQPLIRSTLLYHHFK